MLKATTLEERAKRIFTMDDIARERQAAREEAFALQQQCKEATKLANSFSERLEVARYLDDEIDVTNHVDYILSLCAINAVDVPHYLPNLRTA